MATLYSVVDPVSSGRVTNRTILARRPLSKIKERRAANGRFITTDIVHGYTNAFVVLGFPLVG
jgi:hypothetical protein